MHQKRLLPLHILLGLVIASIILFPFGSTIAQSEATSTDTATPDVSSPTETPTPTPTAVDTETPPPTDTPTVTQTPPESPTPTETPLPTETPSPTETPTDTATPAPTITATPLPPRLGEAAGGLPQLSDVLNRLATTYSAGGVSAAGDFAQANGLGQAMQNNNESVQVVAMLAAGRTTNEARDIVATFSGLVEAESGNLVQISIPIRNLQALAVSPIFLGIRLPAYAEPMAGTYNSEGVDDSGANTWHEVGLTGRGVRVAIVDLGFNGYTSVLGNELPPTTLVHTRSFRADGSLVATDHGNQVAQIVYDMAPGVELWLVAIGTDLEFAEAMDWLISENVDVINASLGWTNYDDGDGDSSIGDVNPLDDSVDRVYNAGILYVAAAGNSAVGHHAMTYSNLNTTIPGFDPIDEPPAPPPGDITNYDYHQWTGVDVLNDITNWSTCPPGFSCYVEANLAWNDWGDTNPGKDYDLFILQSTNGGVSWTMIASSVNDQLSGYPWPTERVGAFVPAGGQVAIVVQRYNSSTSEYLELFVNGWDLQVDSVTSSILSPADAPNAFTVGAHNWLSNSLELFSSQGPVNGAGGGPGGTAIKPDITGPDCTMTSILHTGDGLHDFCGTSGAAPHVAGAAALVWQAFPGYTNTDVRNFLETRADDLDGGLGSPDDNTKDNSFGWGRLKMGSIPNGPLACTPGTATCVAGSADAWPLFQNVPERSGLSPATVSTGASLMWTDPLGADVRSVVVGPPNDAWGRGLVFVKAGQYVYGVEPDRGAASGGAAWSWSGEGIQWKFDLGAAGAAKGPGAPAVTDYNNNGTVGDTSDDTLFVYVGSGDGYVYKLDGMDNDWLPYDSNDSSTWGAQPVCKSAKLGTDLSKASPVIGADGTVYFVDDTAATDRLIAVNPDCSQKWAINVGAGAGTSSPVYWANPASGDTNDDLLFVGADKLHAVTIWGGIKWSQPIKTGAEVATVPGTPEVLNTAGGWRVYVVNSLGDLYRISASDGTSLTRVLDAATGVTHGAGALASYYDPFIGGYMIHWGNSDGKLYRAESTDFFNLPILLGGNLADASPVTDNAAGISHTIFIGSSDGKVYAVNGGSFTQITTNWPKVAGVSTAVGFAIGPDGWLYVPSSDDNLRAYGVLPGGCPDCVAEPGSDWPMFQQNQSNTGASGLTVGSNPSLLWQRAPGGDVFPPVVGEYNWYMGDTSFPQGIAYFVTGRYLRAYDLATRASIMDGCCWPYDLGVAGTPVGFAAPVVANNNGSAPGFGDGIVYVAGKDGILHAVNARWGYDQWRTDVGGDISKASPVIGDDGTVYVVEDAAVDRLIAVSHTGAVRWAANIGAAAGTSAPAYDSGGDCIFVGGNRLYGFASSGGPCSGWNAAGYTLGASTTTVPGAPLLAGGYVYALNSLGDLYRVPLGGGGAATLVYDAPTATGSGSLAYDVGGGAGGYLYWTLGGKLYRWDITGAAATPINLSGTTANSTPVIDAAGNVFVGTSDNKLYVVTRTGTTATLRFTAAGSMANAGAITQNTDLDSNNVGTLWPSASVVFQSQLFVGTLNWAKGGEVWRSVTDTTLEQVNENGFGIHNDAVDALEVFNSQLYASASNYWDGVSIWRTSDGDNWSVVNTGGLGQGGGNPVIRDMIVFNSQLYASPGNWATAPGQIWRTADGDNWSQIAGLESSTGAFGPMVTYNSAIYAATCGAPDPDPGVEIWRSDTGDDSSWSAVVTGGFGDTDNGCVRGLMEFSGALYAAVRNSTDGAQIWRSTTGDSGSWTQVNTSGFGSADNTRTGGFAVFGGNLYVGTGNDTTGAQLWRSSDGTTWTSVMTDGFGDINNYKIESLAVFNSAIYAVTDNNSGLEVWRSTDGSSWSQVNTPVNTGRGLLLWPSADDNLYAFGAPESLCNSCDLADVQWPMFQRSAWHDPGQVSSGGTNIRESRVYTLSGAIRPPVADEQNDRIYFVAGQYLYARARWGDSPAWWDGSVEKKYNLGVAVTAGVYGMPALGRDTSRPDGDQIIIYVGGSDGVLHAVTASNGDLLWKTDVGNNISKASPAVSDGGFIFVVEDNAAPANDRLIAVDAKGSIVWWKYIGSSDGASSPAIDNLGTDGVPSDDVVLVGGGAGLYAFKVTDGTTPSGWTTTLVPIGVTNGAPTVKRIYEDPDGSDPVDPPTPFFDAYYVVTKDGELARIINDTQYSMLADVPGIGKSAAPAVVASCHNYSSGDPSSCADPADWNTRISFGVGNTLYEYFNGEPNNDGQLRSVVLGGDLGDSTPLADIYAIYIGSTDNKLYAVSDPWWLNNIGWVSAPSGGSMAGSGTFINQWTFIWPSQDGKLHVYEYGGGDTNAPIGAVGQWPVFQHDNFRQGAASVALPASPVEQWAVLGAGDVRGPVIGELDQPFNDGTYPDGVAYYVAGTKLYALDVGTHLIIKQWDLGATSGLTGYGVPAVYRIDPQNTPGDPNDDEVRIVVADKNGVVKMVGSWFCSAVYCGTDQWGWWDGAWSMADVGLDASKASVLAGRNYQIYVLEDAASDRLHGINQWSGAISWTTTLGPGNGSSSPAYYDGAPDRVFAGADKLYAVNANTGSILWSRSLGAPINSAPLVIDLASGTDYVYALTSAAKLYRIPVTGGTNAPTPLVSSIIGTVGAASMAAFEYDTGNHYYYIYFAVGNKLYRFDTQTNTLFSASGLTLTPPIGAPLLTNFANSTPLVDSDGKVFIGGADGWLYGVDGLTMNALTPAWNAVDGTGWPKMIGVGTTASSAAGALAMDANGYLYAPSMDDNLRRFGPAVPAACAECRLYTEAQWPMFQHDVSHTGRNTSGVGHRTPVVHWTRTNPAPWTPPRTAVLSAATTNNPSGMLYYTSGQWVFRRSALGYWRGGFDLGAAGAPSGGASPALLLRSANGGGADDDEVWVIVGAKDGFLYALDAQPDQAFYDVDTPMTMIWRIDLGGDISKSSPVIGSDGTIYIVEDATPNDKLHAVYWNGTRKWTRTLAAGTGASSPTLDSASATTRVYVSSGNKVFAFDTTTPTGTQLWATTMPAGTFDTATLLSGADLWALNSTGSLYRLNAATGIITDGNLLNAIPNEPIVAGTGAVGSGVSPAIQIDTYTGYHLIYYTAGSNIYRVLWNAGTTSKVSHVSRTFAATLGNTSPIIDANGWAYVLDSTGYLRAFYRYSVYMSVFTKKVATQGTATGGGVIIGNDGRLYVPSLNSTFYGVGRP